jgi:hypothetical protein
MMITVVSGIAEEFESFNTFHSAHPNVGDHQVKSVSLQGFFRLFNSAARYNSREPVTKNVRQ